MEQIITTLIDAATQGQWVVVAGAAVMVLVAVIQWGAKTFAKRIPAKAMPWVSAAAGTLSGVGLGLLTAKIAWWQAALGGLVAGAAASGLWSLVGKHLLRGFLSDGSEETK